MNNFDFIRYFPVREIYVQTSGDHHNPPLFGCHLHKNDILRNKNNTNNWRYSTHK